MKKIKTLPDWDICEKAVQKMNADPLQEFIYDNDPYTEWVEEKFRNGLLKLIQFLQGGTLEEKKRDYDKPSAMKAYEKWLDSTSMAHPAHNDAWEVGLVEGSEMGWRASMEQVLNQMKQNRFMANGELQTWIEQELGGTDESV